MAYCRQVGSVYGERGDQLCNDFTFSHYHHHMNMYNLWLACSMVKYTLTHMAEIQILGGALNSRAEACSRTTTGTGPHALWQTETVYTIKIDVITRILLYLKFYRLGYLPKFD